jgi:hypothetical protein
MNVGVLQAESPYSLAPSSSGFTDRRSMRVIASRFCDLSLDAHSCRRILEEVRLAAENLPRRQLRHEYRFIQH